MQITQVPGKLTVSWLSDVKAVWDQWHDYALTFAEFEEAVMKKGLSHAKRNGAIAWIADASEAKNLMSQEIQDYIAKTVFKTFVSIGVKYFISITPKSAIAKLGVMKYQAQVGPAGIKLVEVGTLIEAKDFLAKQAKKP
jgi:hypothetical protein